ncbi:MAG: aminoacetone oxidase family FAD-binding enzyme [bacterium]
MNNHGNKNLVIIGGGAVGLTSAVHASNIAKQNNYNLNIIILEKLDRVGKKILSTGNGRCNFTNINMDFNNFYHIDQNFNNFDSFINFFLQEFSVEDAIKFFYDLGVLHTVLNSGKVYPFSEQASAILDALRNKIENTTNITTKTQFDVNKIKVAGNNKFLINNNINADAIIFATGGLASPKLGSDGSGIKLLKSLGHSSTKLTPALVQLKTSNTNSLKALKGIKITGNLKIYGDINNKSTFLREDFGEILFTDYGISGPPVFQLSTLFARYNNLVAYLDFMPNYSEYQIFNILKDRRTSLSYTNLENYFNGLLNKRLGNIIAKNCGIEKLSFIVENLEDKTLKKMAKLIKNFELKIIDTNGFNNAQVTAGGLKLSEFNNKTLESKIIKNLYCAGEILDVVGDCGGYNLQWAWSSSYIATKSCINSLYKS